MQKIVALTKKQVSGGFTIIEMIVVIAIIAVVTTLVLFNQAKLNSAILVSNTAYEIGLIVREAQVEGLGVKATADGFLSSYGVHFDISKPTLITMFADRNNNGTYDSTEGEMTQEYVINNTRSGTVLGICPVESLTVKRLKLYCTSNRSKSTLDVVFTRPNPEALFKVGEPTGSSPGSYVGAFVVNVGFEGDMCRSVIIEKTGAVEIAKTHCTPMQ